MRARLTPHIWQALREGIVLNRGDGLPEETIFVGLTSILWREAWKYGDRAFRYCQHDVGHALGALGIAAAGLGWQARLLDDLGTDQLETLLGVADPRGAEPEHPDCLVAVFPQSAHFQQWKLPESILDIFRPIGWQGQPNVLSPSHVEWRWAEAAAEMTGKPANSELQTADSKWQMADSKWQRSVTDDTPNTASAAQSQSASLTLQRIIHQRRSAQEMDGQTAIGAGCVLPDAAAHAAAARGCAVRHAALAAARRSGASSSTA